MKLPHKEPLIYAKEILFRDLNNVKVRCGFNVVPTLAMFVEAAAQSSAAFNRDEDVKVGFLSMSKNVRALEDITEKEYLFKLNKEAEIHNYRQFRFQAFTLKNSTLIVTGKFTLVLEQ